MAPRGGEGGDGRPADEESRDGAPEDPAAVRRRRPGLAMEVGNLGNRLAGGAASLSKSLRERAEAWAAPDPSVQDSMTYDASILTDWRVFFALGLKATVTHGAVLPMMWRLFIVSLAIAILSVALIPDPDRLKSSRFKEIGKFLQVFVGLLLGFFLSSSVDRWYQCVDGFLHLFDTVRTLQMQFCALGVPNEARHRALRYGFLSAWLLSEELRIKCLPDDKHQSAMDQVWEDLVATSPDDSLCYADKGEVQVLRKVSDPASDIWVWVASLLGHMSHEGIVPPMPSPTWGRLLAFVEDAHNAIRSVKAAIAVRAPFLYVQMLSLLVHVNGIVNAVSLGMTLGVTVGTVGTRFRTWRQTGGYVSKANRTDVLLDFENLAVTVFINFLGPMLYLVIFEVCVAMTEPFKHQGSTTAAYSLNINRLLRTLEVDMSDGAHLAMTTPSWEAPSFSKKAVPAAAGQERLTSSGRPQA